ncbi:MAG TPA: SPFH domain-containing protein [Candidatus Limnocylindrales bacterium]|jgi:regulator of protease activity HflC (stomatin/prohibitin superfamily)
MADETSTNPVPAATLVAGGVETQASYQQLTQSRVPLEDADSAFSTPDAIGRLPIVILPDQPLRVRNELVIGGILAILAGILLSIDFFIKGGIVVVGVVLVFLGVFQAFIVVIPEGSRAILLRGGRFLKTIGAGRHILSPAIIVTRLVTVREIPFSASALGQPSKDDVRVDIDVLLTFTITQPEKFVFAISAPDFDQVCLAASLEAARVLVRSKNADELLDLADSDYAAPRDNVGAALAPYGVTIQRWLVTSVRPPVDFMATREARRILAARKAEQAERYALDQQLQHDRDELEALRLQRLEERLTAYPAAVRQDVLDRRIAVARELAANTRAMVQVGPGGDVADALILDSLTADDGAAPGARRPSEKTQSRARPKP